MFDINENEQSLTICNDMEKSLYYTVEWEKPDTKEYNLHYILYTQTYTHTQKQNAFMLLEVNTVVTHGAG